MILVLGLNHRTAPVELRERLAFSREGAAAALMLFKEQYSTSEAVLLSTCNRVELVINSDTVDAREATSFLARARNLAVASFSNHLYHVTGPAAIRHVFRVISGLDSMVLGEYQIVNQLKTAYQAAHEAGTAGPVLHRLFHHAFGVSKRVRTETALGEGKTSISSVAVDVIKKVCPDFAARHILVVGAGEMAQLTVQHLKAHNAQDLVITTRTLQNARVLAEASHGNAIPFAELDDELALADIVITSTSCPTAILTQPRIRRAMARRGPSADPRLLLIDLAVPRNIDADVVSVPGVTLFDVDALGNLVEEVRRQRAAAVETSESIINDEVEGFEKWLAQAKVGPLIEQMYNDVRALAEIEVRATLRKCPDLTPVQRDAIEALADRLVAKLMHPCVRTVRETSAAEPAMKLVDAFHATRMNLAPA
jgi:glutamyl-tRNA reductase